MATVKTNAELRRELNRLDGKGYKAYRDIEGVWYEFEKFDLRIDRAQGDPFAAPSACRVWVPPEIGGFPQDCFGSAIRQVAFRDFLNRKFAAAAFSASRGGGDRGSGKSGQISIERPSQAILPRSSVVLLPDEQQLGVEVRFTVGLPAFGRRIAGRQAESLLCDRLVQVVERSLLAASLNLKALKQHLDTAEDSHWLRSQLADKNLVAFVPNGACLPRRSGSDDRPAEGDVVQFQSPPSLGVTFNCPHTGEIAGMGIPQGITLLVGGGYHGKSTLLQAMERGIYDHIPGDGRERVVTDPNAVKVRAEDGRSIVGTDISAFINGLPQGTSTKSFVTPNASGSTSQAAAIMEAVEAGTTLLLADEDSCATNLMGRDRRMQTLVAKDNEPITPLLDKIRLLYQERQVSWVLAMGANGDYFDVADTIIAMESYRPVDVTERAKTIAQEQPSGRAAEGGDSIGQLTERFFDAASIDPSRGKRDVKWTVRDTRLLSFGTEDIDLTAIAQLVEPAQLRAIALGLLAVKEELKSQQCDMPTILDAVLGHVSEKGLDGLMESRPRGDLAQFRRFELAAALNRLRSLRLR
ncbi:MAG: ABC-ATPase domain-containing protein [Cyanophyceae cyanobacterium]